MELFWCVEINNLEGENYLYYFKNYKIARENFLSIVNKNKNQDEFQYDGEAFCSWFDAHWNEYSTFVELVQKELPYIFDTVIL